ncbi:MAG: DUF1392 domain-containing protein [Nostoc sp.]|uniref:DUF1392 domain-containing protein n=1 Tax=Nostoc sp. TaxID=1180 RepID=UPI002FF6A010
MINQIVTLESCWHSSSPWGKAMPSLAVQILEKVLLSSSDISGYCCGVQWERQEWIYAIVCCREILYLPQEEIFGTKLVEKATVATPVFELGDVVEVDFGEKPTRRIIQGIFCLKNNWLYAVEWHSPTLSEMELAQSRIIWLADVDLVKVKG